MGARSRRSPRRSTSSPPAFPVLVIARLFLGAGEGLIYTAGSAWVVDLAPDERRGQIIGWYGLAIWGGLSLGPAIGELILQAAGFDAVWAFALAAPLVGALIALRIPESFRPGAEHEPSGPLIAREAIRPGFAFSCGTVGFAAVSGVHRPACSRRAGSAAARSPSPPSRRPWSGFG